eukprot:351762-Chlamydomonas_euryale.AAC.11
MPLILPFLVEPLTPPLPVGPLTRPFPVAPRILPFPDVPLTPPLSCHNCGSCREGAARGRVFLLGSRQLRAVPRHAQVRLNGGLLPALLPAAAATGMCVRVHWGREPDVNSPPGRRWQLLIQMLTSGWLGWAGTGYGHHGHPKPL